ncbi:BZ3500_MvSof-1268-A1-R1_Chr2-2g05081 [Microbotryum saponariae]|uniref:BZ3500_MvSof-1268-A1-R1_Chr2-2g05081 protein n=1 Tax=Microbotryum saponariae TaxID=289078 RepID=A0A2X0M9C8_9BASI|nr:BZ3500_MvSof-1268-A1-R1_Chr2-2g05081 [Microbotryum saponariae]SDA00863.1 BZ3501_MvSof-1269-A2-R1_Chr2-2g04755 [Microbotryum saponariae]
MTSTRPSARPPAERVQAEEEPEFTLRAVVAGLVIGTLLCFTNMYFGLQSGWISMMSLQASLLGFAVFKIVLQTTAVATGTLPLAAGLVGVIPALAQLSPSIDGSPPLVLSFVALCAWCFAVAFFGVFLAVPLRRQVIVKEKLVFPSGTATAQIISVLHDVPPPRVSAVRKRNGYRALGSEEQQGEEEATSGPRSRSVEEEAPLHASAHRKIDQKGWVALSVSFSLSAGFTVSIVGVPESDGVRRLPQRASLQLLSLCFPVVYAIPIFDVFGHLAHEWLWWFTPSFSYIGQGIIMGLPTTASMNVGMFVGWAILSPLAKTRGWAPGPVSSSVDGSRGWILWPALAVMMVESIFSVSIVAFTQIAGPLRSMLGRSTQGLHEDEDEDEDDNGDAEEDDFAPSGSRVEEEADPRLVLGGIVLSCVACVVLVSIVFGQDGIKWWATLIALVLASIFSILGVRALGETDLNPVSAIGKISQLLFTIVQPHNVVANLIAGGISEAGAQQAGDLMQDLKTGHLQGASPKAQFQGQMIGSLASVFVSSGIYVLYRRVYDLPSTNFPVPTAAIWLNLARLVNKGQLPPQSSATMIVFALVFVVLSALKVLGRGRSWVKIAFAIGFINTPSFSIARLIGGFVSFYMTRQTAQRRGHNATGEHANAHLENIGLIIVASGFVLGEGFASVVGLATKSAGLGPVSCWGCGSGGGGYCGGC